VIVSPIAYKELSHRSLYGNLTQSNKPAQITTCKERDRLFPRAHRVQE